MFHKPMICIVGLHRAVVSAHYSSYYTCIHWVIYSELHLHYKQSRSVLHSQTFQNTLIQNRTLQQDKNKLEGAHQLGSL